MRIVFEAVRIDLVRGATVFVRSTSFPAIIQALQQGATASLSASLEDVHACHKGMYAAVEKHCGRFDSYSLKFSKDLTDLCERVTIADIERAIAHGYA